MEKRKVKKIILIIVLIFAVLAGFRIITKIIKSQKDKNLSKIETSVEVIKVYPKDTIIALNYTGTVYPVCQVNLFFKVPGKVRAVYVKEGDFVKKGQVLAQLEDDEVKAQLAMAQVQLKQAKTGFNFQNITTETQIDKAKVNFENTKRDLDRMNVLYPKGAISKQQLDLTQVQYDLAEATLEQAKAGESQDIIQKENIASAAANIQLAEAHLNNTVLRSPGDGVITYRQLEVGDTVSPQVSNMQTQGVFTVTDDSSVYVQAFASEEDFDELKISQNTKVVIPSLSNKIYSGKIDVLIGAGDPKTKLFKLKVNIPNPDKEIKAQMLANLEIETKKITDAIAVPREAVIKNIQGENVVFIALSDTAKERKVKTGPSNVSEIIIEEGLNSGDVVIVKGQTYLRDGDKVVIVGRGQ